MNGGSRPHVPVDILNVAGKLVAGARTPVCMAGAPKPLLGSMVPVSLDRCASPMPGLGGWNPGTQDGSSAMLLVRVLGFID